MTKQLSSSKKISLRNSETSPLNHDNSIDLNQTAKSINQDESQLQSDLERIGVLEWTDSEEYLNNYIISPPTYLYNYIIFRE